MKPLEQEIRRRKLYEDIVAHLEAMISEGKYAPGDRLPSERDMMENFGVGRTAVREALFALQKKGLVAIANGERARITFPTAHGMIDDLSGVARHMLSQPGGIAHFQQARSFLEVSLARYAAEYATSDEIERLRQALLTNQRALDDKEEFIRTDVAFHYVLAEIPHNPIFTAMHEALVNWLTEQRATSTLARGSSRAAYRAHRMIYEAIASRQVDGAGQAMKQHLEEVAKYYWRVALPTGSRPGHVVKSG